MILVPIALIIVLVESLQFIGWVALSCVNINNILDGIVTKLQCFIFHIKIAMNRVPLCEITLILSLKQHMCIVVDLFTGLFYKKR